MPIYEYRCDACGHTLEALQKISDPPLEGCPECQKPSLKRLVSAPVFRLKGGGWYETDFKSDKEKKRNLVDSGDGPKGDSGGSDKGSKSESKDTSAKKSDSGKTAAAAT
ncbi:MAG TPA: zinc ribbon domain-containing protein [Gammaproteobacteria bacterium]